MKIRSAVFTDFIAGGLRQILQSHGPNFCKSSLKKKKCRYIVTLKHVYDWMNTLQRQYFHYEMRLHVFTTYFIWERSENRSGFLISAVQTGGIQSGEREDMLGVRKIKRNNIKQVQSSH
jgi:hypothetical protein